MISTTFYYYYEVSKNTYLCEASATTSTSGDDAQNIAIDIDCTNGNGQNTMAVDDISRSDNSDDYDLTFEPIALADYVWTLIKYTPHQVAKMIGLVEYKRLSVRKAAELTNISNSCAHQLYKQHKEDSSLTPGYKAKNQIKRLRKIDLTDEQRQIVDLYVKSVADQNANVVKVKDAQKTVKEQIQQTVAFTLVLPAVPPYTATSDILESRSKFAGELMSRSLDYIEGCMFISEGAVVMSETLVVEARTTRSEAKSYDLNIFLCLTAGGVLAVSQEAMVAEAQRKQRQMEKVGKAKGTAPDHLIQFTSEVFKTIS
ncbi:hypothetical protein BDB00DRAFT_793528 [Zychaea mexicana]|uniref:uncharacterized protein n=1 Tax=Zychaea mexicana TaxID=64656 RepID=UPI0022FE2132|nr:uncharacterized protein BDB00DRAFT_793528 [Zychaea mexicana]KAI9472893.1 hypothetical protein BDB00DRAFT_793528 [Zychaea mexicana]